MQDCMRAFTLSRNAVRRTAERRPQNFARSSCSTLKPPSAILAITPSLTWLTSLWRSAVPNRFVMAPMRAPLRGVGSCAAKRLLNLPP
jgi:hypothetical protein